MANQRSGRRVAARHLLTRRTSEQDEDQARIGKRSGSSPAPEAQLPNRANPLAELQKSAGNRATSRALTAMGHQPGPSPILRYPSSVLEQPLKNKDWKKYTKTVAKSGEGVSGGVYFFGSKKGPVKKVVVKPEAHGEAKDKDVANSLLASAGVPVPKGRIVFPDTTEGRDIVAAGQRAGANLSLSGSGGVFNTTFFEVMSTVSGSSLSTTSKKAASGETPEALAENINQLVLLLSAPNVRQQLATMMARDAIAGNIDRVMKDGLSNIGNIMIEKRNDNKVLPRALQSRITAIDSEGTTDEFAKQQQRDYVHHLNDLGKNPVIYVDRFFESIVYYLDQTNPQAGAMFTSHEKYGAMHQDLLTSLKQAAMKEALLGARSKETKSEAPMEQELRHRRMVLWDLLTS